MPSGNKPLPEPDLGGYMMSLGHNELNRFYDGDGDGDGDGDDWLIMMPMALFE